MFPAEDEPLLKYKWEESLRVEPDWYVPIIPMVLINGADGIGTGWSTRIYNHDVREIVANLRRMLDGEEPREMVSSRDWQMAHRVWVGTSRQLTLMLILLFVHGGLGIQEGVSGKLGVFD